LGGRGLDDILDVMARLASSGLLDSESIQGLARLALIIEAAGRGASRLESSEAVAAADRISTIVECLLKAASKLDPERVEPVGLLGLMRSLGDPDFQRGLGLLVELVRGLGRCCADKDSPPHQ